MKNLQFLEVKFSVYLNRYVFVTACICLMPARVLDWKIKRILFYSILYPFQCDAGLATFKMTNMMHLPPTKIMLLGCGCSPETEATSQVSHHYNVTQVFIINITRLQDSILRY